MGVATASIRLRASPGNTVAAFVETSNAVWQLFEDAGMVKVTNTDYAGQAGRLTTGTPGVGQTQITALGTTIGWPTNPYYNVYRHPNLGFYIKVFACDVGISSTASRVYVPRYGFFFDLDGLGSHVESGYASYSPSDVWTGPNPVGVNIGQLPTTYTNTYVSVAPDHFWLGSDPHNYPVSSYSYPNSYYYGSGRSRMSFGVFRDTDAFGDLVAVLPATSTNTAGNSQTSTFYWGTFSNAAEGGQNNNKYQHTAIKYYTYAKGEKTPVFRGGAAAGFIVDPGTPITGVGTRVQQAQLYINGVLRRFDFGFAPEASTADATVFETNLSGTGVKKYRMQKGFGPANPGIGGNDNTLYDTTNNSSIFLPWAAP